MPNNFHNQSLGLGYSHIVAPICGPILELLSKIRNGRVLKVVPKGLDEGSAQVATESRVIRE